MIIAKFTYNNTKNANISYTYFKLNFSYYLPIFFKENFNFRFQSKLANKLLIKLKKLRIIFQKNFYYIQKLQIYIYNKNAKPKSYVLDN